MFTAKENRRLVILTYISLTVGMIMLYYLFPDNSYKIAAIIIYPFICWLPFDLKWINSKRSKHQESRL
ncbi:hypothetical protein QWY14_03570 [Planococcus sp. N028]|uniref:Uncharacterized protein n=1 Tax=Planococcus shixiaomingii TaxID=3058393 RepID=A0ABT8MYZ1_9BACL|nr:MULTISPECIES: hypothetical protein [unclassified Planococcus (in: firmicutes)]MDN7240851.1 hypothetical protein [Planococcus sp. N028]WKA53095.1 hypothetical protein QWY21_10505 [Planococcus sp. N022]